jgi:hypothetical protein
VLGWLLRDCQNRNSSIAYVCCSSEGFKGSSHPDACDSNCSMPALRESKDREIWPSCEFGSRFNDIALCRSSSESLI